MALWAYNWTYKDTAAPRSHIIRGQIQLFFRIGVDDLRKFMDDQRYNIILPNGDGTLTLVQSKHKLPQLVWFHQSDAYVDHWKAHATVSEEPDDELGLTLPDIAQKLLPFIVPKKLRANVTGDLAEDFRTYATQWGRPYALRWLWWELGGLCIRRFGPTAFITGIGVWLRQKLGL